MYLFWICNVPADQGAVQSLNRFTKQIRDAVKIEFLQSNPTNTSAWIIEARQSLIEHPFWQFFLVQKAIHVRKLSECSMRHSFPSFLCFILENRFNSPQKIDYRCPRVWFSQAFSSKNLLQFPEIWFQNDNQSGRATRRNLHEVERSTRWLETRQIRNFLITVSETKQILGGWIVVLSDWRTSGLQFHPLRHWE